MSKVVRRGYEPEDETWFNGNVITKLKKAKEEVCYLLDHDYPIKQVTTFVGNHYMFSERQRLALTRITSPKHSLILRKEKRIELDALSGQILHIDGFNTIITLEVLLSGSVLLRCQDGCIRDLAGLRGTYRIIDKTSMALQRLLEKLQQLKVKGAVIYLDQPVSNSGRLKQLILESAAEYELDIMVEIRNDVDTVLESKDYVVTSDAIILNKCKSWVNIVSALLAEAENKTWLVSLEDK